MKFIPTVILTILVFLFMYCKKETKHHPSNTIDERRVKSTLRDSCLKQMNAKLVELLSDKEALTAAFGLKKHEPVLITNPLKTNPFYKKNQLIKKLIPYLSDTTDLGLRCNFFDFKKACKGDLALLSIYTVERFPFALALKMQWCTGGPIAENIYLPYNWLEYTFSSRESIKNAYFEYYLGKERIDYLKAK